jgi:hypothetical protein
MLAAPGCASVSAGARVHSAVQLSAGGAPHAAVAAASDRESPPVRWLSAAAVGVLRTNRRRRRRGGGEGAAARGRGREPCPALRVEAYASVTQGPMLPKRGFILPTALTAAVKCVRSRSCLGHQRTSWKENLAETCAPAEAMQLAFVSTAPRTRTRPASSLWDLRPRCWELGPPQGFAPGERNPRYRPPMSVLVRERHHTHLALCRPPAPGHGEGPDQESAKACCRGHCLVGYGAAASVRASA